MYIRELTVRYKRRRISIGLPLPEGPLTRPVDIASLFAKVLAHEAVEVCGVLCLTTCRSPIAYHELSRGTLDHTIVQPRDVFRIALLAHAHAVVVGHNHPAGSALPSADDVALTRRLAAAGVLLEIEFLDHFIVTADGRYYSFKEHGRLDREDTHE